MGAACCAEAQFIRQNSPYKASKLCSSSSSANTILINKVKQAIRQLEEEK